MPYRIIKGAFHLFYQKQKLIGSQPDGNSIWFKPDQRALLDKLGDNRREVVFNAGGCTLLRYEAIEALELHHRGSHQHLRLATKAREFALERLGFLMVEFSTGEGLSVRDASPHPLPGYILTRSIAPDGRPIAFAFAGKTPRADGSEVWLDVKWTSRSVNSKLAEAGWGYPAFYEGLPLDLRQHFTAAINAAWGHRRGAWDKDKTRSGVVITALADLENHALWPKLYRRLLAYFKDGNKGLAGFAAWLRAGANRNDKLWIVPEGRAARLHEVIRVAGNKISLTHWPEELVIVPR